MTDISNPYAPPQSNLGSPSRPNGFGTASLPQRFLTVLIDQFGMFVFMILVMIPLVTIDLILETHIVEGTTDLVLSWFNMLLYYVIFESTSGRTLGKLIVGTRVVAEDGTRPSLKKILGRTLIRFIPFEPFSFFGSSDSGWHDRWSGTRVVRTRPTKWQQAAEL